MLPTLKFFFRGVHKSIHLPVFGRVFCFELHVALEMLLDLHDHLLVMLMQRYLEPASVFECEQTCKWLHAIAKTCKLTFPFSLSLANVNVEWSESQDGAISAKLKHLKRIAENERCNGVHLKLFVSIGQGGWHLPWRRCQATRDDDVHGLRNALHCLTCMPNVFITTFSLWAPCYIVQAKHMAIFVLPLRMFQKTDCFDATKQRQIQSVSIVIGNANEATLRVLCHDMFHCGQLECRNVLDLVIKGEYIVADDISSQKIVTRLITSQKRVREVGIGGSLFSNMAILPKPLGEAQTTMVLNNLRVFNVAQIAFNSVQKFLDFTSDVSIFFRNLVTVSCTVVFCLPRSADVGSPDIGSARTAQVVNQVVYDQMCNGWLDVLRSLNRLENCSIWSSLSIGKKSWILHNLVKVFDLCALATSRLSYLNFAFGQPLFVGNRDRAIPVSEDDVKSSELLALFSQYRSTYMNRAPIHTETVDNVLICGEEMIRNVCNGTIEYLPLVVYTPCKLGLFPVSTFYMEVADLEYAKTPACKYGAVMKKNVEAIGCLEYLVSRVCVRYAANGAHCIRDFTVNALYWLESQLRANEEKGVRFQLLARPIVYIDIVADTRCTGLDNRLGLPLNLAESDTIALAVLGNALKEHDGGLVVSLCNVKISCKLFYSTLDEICELSQTV